MHQSVRSAFADITRPLEADLPYMYRDPGPNGWITCGMGLRIEEAPGVISRVGLALPWRWGSQTGVWATEADIRGEFVRIREAGGTWTTARTVHRLELAQADRDEARVRHMEDDERHLRLQFPGWDALPADAQLALLSLAWWSGSNIEAGWPALTQAVRAPDRTVPDFLQAARIMGGVKTPNARTRQCRQLFAHAAVEASLQVVPGELRYLTARLSVAQVSRKAAESPKVVSIQTGYVQAQLILAGSQPGPLDGIFGLQTLGAFGQFCKARGLPAEVTRAALTALGLAAVLPVTIVS